MALDPESQEPPQPDGRGQPPGLDRGSSAGPTRASNTSRTRAPAQGPLPHGVTVTNRTIPGPRRAPLSVRLLPARQCSGQRPSCRRWSSPTAAAWVFGNLEQPTTCWCAQLAMGAGIAGRRDRLSPRPGGAFSPGAFDDVVAGLKWVAANGRRDRQSTPPSSRSAAEQRPAANPRRSGGTVGARSQRPPKLKMQLLAYPVTRRRGAVRSPIALFVDGYGLNAPTMEVVLRPLHAPTRPAARRLAGSRRCAPSHSLACPPTLVVNRRLRRAARRGAAPMRGGCRKEGTVTDLVGVLAACCTVSLSSPMLLHGARRGTGAVRRRPARGAGAAAIGDGLSPAPACWSSHFGEEMSLAGRCPGAQP